MTRATKAGFGRTEIRKLIAWYRREKRALPWRADTNPDPYRIWISEVMSQQSTMVTVVPYFERWMKSLPTLEHLASADFEVIQSLWAGLGYYSRARNLHKAARYIQYELGQFPRSWTDWLNVPGVGPYTAKAIAAIAFGEGVIPIDGNVIRVISRFVGIVDPLNSRADRQKVDEVVQLIESQLDSDEARFLSQALMELGATICRPAGSAKCALCPIAENCWAQKSKKVALLPQKKARPETMEKKLVAHLYLSSANELLVTQVPDGERLEGQWELPLLVAKDSKIKDLRPVRHSITKYRYLVYPLWSNQRPPVMGRSWRYLNPKNQREWAGLTTLSRKVLSAVFAQD